MGVGSQPNSGVKSLGRRLWYLGTRIPPAGFLWAVLEFICFLDLHVLVSFASLCYALPRSRRIIPTVRKTIAFLFPQGHSSSYSPRPLLLFPFQFRITGDTYFLLMSSSHKSDPSPTISAFVLHDRTMFAVCLSPCLCSRLCMHTRFIFTWLPSTVGLLSCRPKIIRDTFGQCSIPTHLPAEHLVALIQ